MGYKELSVRFCGIAGDGIVTSGKILASACAGVGLHVMVNDIYSAEIRGLGKSTTTIRFSASKVPRDFRENGSKLRGFASSVLG